MGLCKKYFAAVGGKINENGALKNILWRHKPPNDF
jgi:hypothetical protein